MSDFFQRLSEQVLQRAAVVQPLRQLRFSLLPDMNLPSPVTLRQPRGVPEPPANRDAPATAAMRLPTPLVPATDRAANLTIPSFRQMSLATAAVRTAPVPHPVWPATDAPDLGTVAQENAAAMPAHTRPSSAAPTAVVTTTDAQTDDSRRSASSRTAAPASGGERQEPTPPPVVAQGQAAVTGVIQRQPAATVAQQADQQVGAQIPRHQAPPLAGTQPTAGTAEATPSLLSGPSDAAIVQATGGIPAQRSEALAELAGFAETQPWLAQADDVPNTMSTAPRRGKVVAEDLANVPAPLVAVTTPPTAFLPRVVGDPLTAPQTRLAQRASTVAEAPQPEFAPLPTQWGESNIPAMPADSPAATETPYVAATHKGSTPKLGTTFSPETQQPTTATAPVADQSIDPQTKPLAREVAVRQPLAGGQEPAAEVLGALPTSRVQVSQQADRVLTSLAAAQTTANTRPMFQVASLPTGTKPVAMTATAGVGRGEAPQVAPSVRQPSLAASTPQPPAAAVTKLPEVEAPVTPTTSRALGTEHGQRQVTVAMSTSPVETASAHAALLQGGQHTTGDISVDQAASRQTGAQVPAARAVMDVDRTVVQTSTDPAASIPPPFTPNRAQQARVALVAVSGRVAELRDAPVAYAAQAASELQPELESAIGARPEMAIVLMDQETAASSSAPRGGISVATKATEMQSTPLYVDAPSMTLGPRVLSAESVASPLHTPLQEIAVERIQRAIGADPAVTPVGVATQPPVDTRVAARTPVVDLSHDFTIAPPQATSGYAPKVGPDQARMWDEKTAMIQTAELFVKPTPPAHQVNAVGGDSSLPPPNPFSIGQQSERGLSVATPVDPTAISPVPGQAAPNVLAVIRPQIEAFVPGRKPVLPAEAQPIPTIRVTIGRVEVRTTPETSKATPAHQPPAPVLSLDDYLQRRQRGGL